MKQLLIVNSAKAVKTGVADDLTVLDAGQIGFFLMLQVLTKVKLHSLIQSLLRTLVLLWVEVLMFLLS